MILDTKGKLLAIAKRSAHRADMTELSSALVTRDSGVQDDCRGKPGRRQVTILSRAEWETACSKISADLPWTHRRANLLTEGVNLREKTGYDLHLGELILTITGETTPCGRMDEAHQGLWPALKPNWRGGVTAFVARSGEITVGCEVLMKRNILRQFAVINFYRTRRFMKRTRGRLGRIARKMGWKKQQAGKPVETPPEAK